MGASKIGKSDRQQCTIKVLYASSGTRQLFLFSLCVVLVMLLCWFESNLFLVVKFEINTLQVECFEDRPMVYSPNHPFPRCIYIYRMLVSPCPMNSSSLHNMDVMILLLIPGWWQWWSARHCGSLHRCGHFWSTHDILGSESTILFEQCLARRVSLEQKRRTWHFRGLEP